SGRSRRCATAGSSPSRLTRSSAPDRGGERPPPCWRPPFTPRPAAPDRPRVAPAPLTRPRLAAPAPLLALPPRVSPPAATLVGPVRASLLTALGPGGAGTPDFIILFRTRLPRVLLGAVVGGALACSGASLQAMLGNPLADPHLLGVSAGAAVAGAIALMA